MIKSLVLENFGPYSGRHEVYLDDVTVLTGRNDTGKSSILTALKVCFGAIKAQESHVNNSRLELNPNWKQDPEVSLGFLLELTPHLIETGYIAPEVATAGAFVRLSRTMPQILSESKPQGKLEKKVVTLLSMPTIIAPDQSQSIGSVINIENPNGLEAQLLTLPSGTRITFDGFKNLRASARLSQLESLDNHINGLIRNFFPSNMPFSIRFTVNDAGNLVTPLLRDDTDSRRSEISARGDGVRKLLNLMCLLATTAAPTGMVLIILDEPENSLHADAQRRLRRFIEALCTRPLVQAVYATHSSTMINQCRPLSVRVFAKQDGSTACLEQPAGDYYSTVRMSLGMTAADSLMYSNSILLLEGDTECRNIVNFMRKACPDSLRSDLEEVLSDFCVIDGKGDNISSHARVALAQGAKPVVLLDSDKAALATKLRSDKVPVVIFEEGMEFEDIVPIPRYLSAIRLLCLDESKEKVHLEGFNSWMETSGCTAKLISKKFEAWCGAMKFGSFPKWKVMEIAIDETPRDEFRTAELNRLIALLSGKSAPT